MPASLRLHGLLPILGQTRQGMSLGDLWMAGAPEGPQTKSLLRGFEIMARIPSLSSPFLLGFDEIERALDRVAKAADGYPPYNIERLARKDGRPERLRITLAVAGFSRRT